MAAVIVRPRATAMPGGTAIPSRSPNTAAWPGRQGQAMPFVPAREPSLLRSGSMRMAVGIACDGCSRGREALSLECGKRSLDVLPAMGQRSATDLEP